MTDQLWALFAIGLAVLLLSLGMWRRGKAGKGDASGGDGGGVWFGGDGGSGDCSGGDGGGGCGGGD